MHMGSLSLGMSMGLSARLLPHTKHRTSVYYQRLCNGRLLQQIVLRPVFCSPCVLCLLSCHTRETFSCCSRRLRKGEEVKLENETVELWQHVCLSSDLTWCFRGHDESRGQLGFVGNQRSIIFLLLQGITCSFLVPKRPFEDKLLVKVETACGPPRAHSHSNVDGRA